MTKKKQPAIQLILCHGLSSLSKVTCGNSVGEHVSDISVFGFARLEHSFVLSVCHEYVIPRIAHLAGTPSKQLPAISVGAVRKARYTEL